MRMTKFHCATLALLLGMMAASAHAAPCLIFVHGKQTTTDTYTNWNHARNYWVDGSNDFIRTATKNFQTPHYVVGYNGTRPYHEPQAAGEVAYEIVNATNGGTDGGGNRCAASYSQGGSFWVIAHSMGGPVMDFILGNNDSSDPNYNFNGPYDQVAARVGLVVTLSGAHRGSQGADAACGDHNWACDAAASWFQSCDAATFWLRSDDAVQVRTFANAPARNVYLTGGYEAIFGASGCMAGEDDGIVQYASIFACNGATNIPYDNSDVCNNANKQEAFGFLNLDSGHENHNDIKQDSDRDVRRQVPDGIWTCNGGVCAPNTVVRNNMSAAQFIGILY